MRLELTRVGLLAELANHYTTRGALNAWIYDLTDSIEPRKQKSKEKKYVDNSKVKWKKILHYRT